MEPWLTKQTKCKICGHGLRSLLLVDVCVRCRHENPELCIEKGYTCQEISLALYASLHDSPPKKKQKLSPPEPENLILCHACKGPPVLVLECGHLLCSKCSNLRKSKESRLHPVRYLCNHPTERCPQEGHEKSKPNKKLFSPGFLEISSENRSIFSRRPLPKLPKFFSRKNSLKNFEIFPSLKSF